jgi:AbrB family looped-hinge helix DNA binding protein
MSQKESQSKIVRSLRGGQVTIPAEFRDQLGIREDSLLKMTLKHGELHIVPVKVATAQQGSPWFRELYEYFAPVRQEILDRGISDEEVDADIDAAVAAVRAERRQKR